MQAADVATVVLPYEQWTQLAQDHAERADALTAAHRERRVRGEAHAVYDFLYTYYGTRPSLLRRWHPGIGVGLAPSPTGEPAPHVAWRWYRHRSDGTVALDPSPLVADRTDAVRAVHRLLTATASRAPFVGCFGLHEWAMVYGEDEHRHSLPLRLGQRGTYAVVEAHELRCTHFDAFRFFTPASTPMNRQRLTRASQVDFEQPGCVHVSMDVHKWASKLAPAVPGSLALDCFELARDARVLDMQASPYDVSAYGLPAVPVETAAGKAEYVARQRALAQRATALRAELLAVCETLLV